jgi:hypothetical protein
VVRFRTCLQLLHCSWFDTCVAYIHNEVESFFQVVGALYNYIQCLEALSRHMTLRCYFCFTTIEVEPD